VQRSRAWLTAAVSRLNKRIREDDAEADRLREKLSKKENEPFLLGQVEYFLAGLSIDWDPGDREQDVPDLLTFLKRTC
jgi:hypothetical protein